MYETLKWTDLLIYLYSNFKFELPRRGYNPGFCAGRDCKFATPILDIIFSTHWADPAWIAIHAASSRRDTLAHFAKL